MNQTVGKFLQFERCRLNHGVGNFLQFEKSERFDFTKFLQFERCVQENCYDWTEL